MLELNKYYAHKIENLKDFFLVCYVIIDDIYKRIIPEEIKFRRNYTQAKLSDSEIITLAIVGEIHGTSSEKSWINYVKKNFKELFPDLCHRTRFNRTRRNLESVINEIRKEISNYLASTTTNLYVIDSMPIHVCGFGRAHFGKRFRDISSYGYCASKKESYYGLKLHAAVTFEGYITDFEITSANIDDRAILWELFQKSYSFIVLGDKGYIGDRLANELKSEKDLTLLANSLSGLKTRLQCKILGHNISCFINKCLGNELGSKIKHLVF